MILYLVSLVFTLPLQTSGATTIGHGHSIIGVTTGEIKENHTHVKRPTVTYNQKPLNITEEMKAAQATTTGFMTSLKTNSPVGMTNATKVIQSTASPMLTRATQSQNMEQTVLPSTIKMTHSSIDSNLISTAATSSTTSLENKPTNIGGDTTPSTESYKPSRVTIITEPNKIQEPPTENLNPVSIHSHVVAGLIGVALVSMVVGILVIIVKRKLQKEQKTTTAWAGPSPFLNHGNDNGQVTLRSSNRISAASFLYQKTSKRLSLLPEIQEESEAKTPASTFGRTHQGSTSESELDTRSALERIDTKKTEDNSPIVTSTKQSITNGDAGNENCDSIGTQENDFGQS
ncbi:uncharacterized protein LOC127609224 [Hippocampus zosterae]|uniref:uncharacterized protein LOC127609224 n=1 Tax=Hippocampus zosterae TaxID=109293 RepID=UPI00223D401B|nr:uncharacterized protein LOC127609224 [Hippocampus zosterae]